VINPVHSEPLLRLAALAWIAAFFGFVQSFGPLLAGVDRKNVRRAPAPRTLSCAGMLTI
jgi:uncharacterized protein involved in response to NO